MPVLKLPHLHSTNKYKTFRNLHFKLFLHKLSLTLSCDILFKNTKNMKLELFTLTGAEMRVYYVFMLFPSFCLLFRFPRVVSRSKQHSTSLKLSFIPSFVQLGCFKYKMFRIFNSKRTKVCSFEVLPHLWM